MGIYVNYLPIYKDVSVNQTHRRTMHRIVSLADKYMLLVLKLGLVKHSGPTHQ